MCGAIPPGLDAVSPRQDAEQARWRDLARAAGGWLFETDAALRFRWVSGPYLPYTDEAGEAVIGQQVLDVPVLGADARPRPTACTCAPAWPTRRRWPTCSPR